ncbi:MAG: 16S rRNA (cytidine(1402)-2'-O)-methyltransferase, partial [Thermodesulfovibrionales bacterium]|nr:16S rRNA (cytidine(1402)-2'-O)-methyltransferase [Thermodesulfovibrionales bacterium]
MQYGVLYIVSTPIGNLEDITIRALRILKEVSLIAAEDTRHSLKLLNYYSIKKPLISCWSEKEKKASNQIISRLKEGLDIALITDAGTPGISDPGSYTIKEVIKEGIEVIPIPGATAFVAALSASGLDCDEFRFIGFLPHKKSHRIHKLQTLIDEPMTLVFYEAPHRLVDCLNDMLNILGDRKAVLAKEITKIHEEFIRDNLSSLS